MGAVREDYSANGEAWDYLPHDHARSRAYRWGEDGLAGFCDIEQRLCLGLALWNGRDPILKERAFGAGFDQMMAQRRAEADEFYVELTPKDATADEGMVMRQAFGGLLWSKQLFYYDVTRRCQRPGLWPR